LPSVVLFVFLLGETADERARYAALRLPPGVAQIFPIYFEENDALCNALILVRLCGLRRELSAADATPVDPQLALETPLTARSESTRVRMTRMLLCLSGIRAAGGYMHPGWMRWRQFVIWHGLQCGGFPASAEGADAVSLVLQCVSNLCMRGPER
jgi:hypothetical protein